MLNFISFFIFFLISTVCWPQAKRTTCPTDNSDSISAWRDLIFEKVRNGHFEEVRNSLKVCFEDQGEAPACLADLKYYNDYKSTPQPSIWDINDLYDQSLTIRSEDEIPQEFWAKDKDQKRRKGFIEIPPDIFELAEKKKWKVETYKTRDRGGFDKSHNLLIIVIPGKDKDIVMQITLDPDAKPEQQIYDPEIHSVSGNLVKGSHTMTMITIDKTQNPPVGQLRKHTQDEITGQYHWSNSLYHHDRLGLDFCIQCHTTPARPLSPVGYRVVHGPEILMSDKKTKSIDQINEILERPGVSWGKAMHNGKEFRFGAPLDSQPWGWAPQNSPTRKQEFIEKCAAKRKPIRHHSRDQQLYKFNADPDLHAKIDWKKISSSMNCISCHNGSDRGVLHSDFQERAIVFKVGVTHEMPRFDDPDVPMPPDLNQDERMALISCLKAERKAVADEWEKSGWWIKRVACENNTSKSGASGAGTIKPKSDSETLRNK